MCREANAFRDGLLGTLPAPVQRSRIPTGAVRGITRTVKACTSVRPMMRFVCTHDADAIAVGDGGMILRRDGRTGKWSSDVSPVTTSAWDWCGVWGVGCGVWGVCATMNVGMQGG